VTGDGTGPILLIEDDEALANLLGHHLQAHGYEVLAASTAEHGKALLSTGSRPSLVLLDLNLPGETGWSVLGHEALRRDGHPPVVVVTALEVRPRHLAEYDLAGYLPKPFAMETLLAIVDRLTTGSSEPEDAPDG
jgi:DNA-binding response OmpR family regulator